MKDEDMKKLAFRIIDLEHRTQKTNKDNLDKAAWREIEYILEELSLEEIFELDEIISSTLHA